jgi:hypothetical protein
VSKGTSCFSLNWLVRYLFDVIVWHLFILSLSDVLFFAFEVKWLNKGRIKYVFDNFCLGIGRNFK